MCWSSYAIIYLFICMDGGRWCLTEGLSGVIVILLLPPPLQLCVPLLFAPPLRFHLPTSRSSLGSQQHLAGSPTPPPWLSPLVMTEGNRDTCWQRFPGKTSGSTQTVLTRAHKKCMQARTALNLHCLWSTCSFSTQTKKKRVLIQKQNPSAGTY